VAATTISGEAGYTNAEGDLPPGCEARGDGGYVIAAGSRFPDGRAWRIEVDEEIASIPGWLSRTVRFRGARASDDNEPVEPLDPGETKAGLRTLAEICLKLIEAPNRIQHKEIFRLSAAAGNLVAAGDVFEATAKDWLLEAARRMKEYRDNEPWTDDQIIHHRDNGIRKGKLKPLAADRTLAGC
jgi:hypothetical protein